MSKIAKVDGRTFHRLGSPGFPSMASKRMYDNELSRFLVYFVNAIRQVDGNIGGEVLVALDTPQLPQTDIIG